MKATLKLNIPSEELTTRPGRLARLFGVKPRPLGHERVVGSTLGILEQIIAALHTLRVDNIISLRVDMRVLFEDQQGREGDLQLLEQKLAQNSSRLGEQFQMIQLAMEHRDQRMHHVLDLTLRGEVNTGDEELVVGIAGRPLALDPHAGMSAADYRDRVAIYVGDDHLASEDWQHFCSFVEEVRHCLAAQLAASHHEISLRENGITNPTKRSLCASASKPFVEHQVSFRQRGFSPGCRHYYRDPYSHCYENPYTALLNLFLLQLLRQNAANGVPPDTKIYASDGSAVGTVAEIHAIYLDDALLRELGSAELLAGLDTGALSADSLLGKMVAEQSAQESAQIAHIAARGRRARAGNRAAGQSTSCRVDVSDSPL